MQAACEERAMIPAVYVNCCEWQSGVMSLKYKDSLLFYMVYYLRGEYDMHRESDENLTGEFAYAHCQRKLLRRKSAVQEGRDMMGKRRWRWCLALLLATAMIAAGAADMLPAMVRAEEQAQENVLKIDASNLYGRNEGIFQGWGTSLCWFGNRIGASEKTSNEAARLLCNQEEGLGLNIIRFNIGGGDEPSHNHITRTDSKMPGYWGTYDEATDTFTYDYTKDERQRNVLNKMLAENKDLTLEAFSNSPPYFMTESGCTSGTAEEKMADNLKADKYDDFAEYLANVVKYYRDSYGVNFTSVEPMNENGWSISRNGHKQEGCTFMEGESRSKMILAMERAMEKYGLQDLILAGCDESSPLETVQCLNKLSQDALNALERIDTHTYSTSKTTKLREKATELSKNLWMSETDGGSIAGTNAGEMGAGLYLAGLIGRDMHMLQPSAWIMWQAIGSYCGKEPFEGNSDPASLNQSEMDKKGFWGVTYADMDKEQVVLTKKYYAMGQYTRYIHEGDSMILGDEQNTVSYDKKNHELKIVVFNASDQVKNMKYDLTGFQWKNPLVKVVRTSGDMKSGENWKLNQPLSASNEGFRAQLAPNSITTFIVKEPAADGGDYPVAEPTITPGGDGSSKPGNQGSGKEPIVKTSAKPKKVTGVKAGKVTKNKAVLTWKKQTGVTGYQVAYSTSKKKLAKIKNGKRKAAAGTKVCSATKNKVTLKKLKKKTAYYVKVCAYRGKGGKAIGNYSAVKKVKTKKK